MQYVATDENYSLSIYAINKLQIYGKNFGYTGLKVKSIYKILSVFSTRILNNNNIDIYEDGLQTGFCIDDVVEATKY